MYGLTLGLSVDRVRPPAGGASDPPDPPGPQAPTADFFGSVLSGSAPLSVSFVGDASSGEIESWSWESNSDGAGWVEFSTNTWSQDDVEFPVGVHSIRLTVTGPGGSNTLTRTNYITVTAPPSLDFSAASNSMYAGSIL